MEYIVTFLQYIIYFWIIEEFFNSFFDEKRELSMVFRMCIWCRRNKPIHSILYIIAEPTEEVKNGL